MVGNNHRKPHIAPTPSPFCHVSTFFLDDWKEDVLYTSYFQALKMFCIGAFEDLLQPIFVSVSWNCHISKAMLFLRWGPLYYQKYCLIYFLWWGEVGWWFFKCARYSHALGYTVKTYLKTINIHALETPLQKSTRLLKRAWRAWLKWAVCHSFPSEHSSMPDYTLPQCLFLQ